GLLFVLPLLWIMSTLWGVHGIWLSMPLAELLTAALIFITNRYATFLTKKGIFSR
ncbi:MATE family efflux transporter, partial [Bacillus cereus]